ncbi:MAG: hypothetical protein HOP07_11870 [Bacteriovoracaceae bacterium]|nr:hypothetical protein [Bacteriovoracaceae bacterium]
MKLKSTIAALLLATSLSTFAVDLTLSPVYTIVGVVQTALESVVGIASSPLASSAATSQQREQLKAIRNDAVDFLSGNEKSARLNSTLEQLRSSEELAGKSDVELSAHIVTAIN